MSDMGFEVDDPELTRNPQAMYKIVRDTMPVMDVDLENRAMKVVSRHEDVIAVLRDPETFSSGVDAVEIGQIRPLIPLQIDPPEHAKYRKLLDPLFAPKRIALLEPATRALVDDLIDQVVDDGQCNFHAAIAEPLPSTVFLQLLGLPVERTQEFIELKDGIIRPPATSPEERSEMVKETGRRIYAVLEEVIAERQHERREDFISQFLDAEVDGHRLTPEDVQDIGYLFFLAGLDTVTASLDCMLAFLSQHPEHRRRLVDDPGLIPHAIEEMLRWETPVTGVVRITTTDTEIGGCPVAAHTAVSTMLGSANTDESVWPEVDTVDFDREVNKHIAFGGGVHRCLGSHLARMELRVTLEAWHERIPDYQLAEGAELVYSMGLRQVDELPLVWNH